MNYDLYQGTWVIVITLLLLGIGFFVTRKSPWTALDKILLLFGCVCYVLDTLWWFFYWHFAWSDLLFNFRGKQYKLTIFFVLAGIFFGIFFMRRFNRKKANQH